MTFPTSPETRPGPSKSPTRRCTRSTTFSSLTSTAIGRDEIVVAAWEGVFVLDRDPAGHWTKTRIGTGNQEAKPFKGASEVKVGQLEDSSPFVATIEPWHGFQVVVYIPPEATRLPQSAPLEHRSGAAR